MIWHDPVPLAEARRLSVIPASFYARPAQEVAPSLLGALVVHGETAGRIVEVEAYLGVNDLAAHAARGITGRTKLLFGPPAHAYVYLIYGMYDCLNFVAERVGEAGCVLIRALEPLSGLEAMRTRRPAARKPEQLCSGPGKLTRAMDITRALNGASITRGALTVRVSAAPKPAVAVGPRIGITHCAEWPLRFYIPGNPCVSKHSHK
jgi:DNA-3-methyladenine glycosylase